MNNPTLAFIGGGNMASALIGGLIKAGSAPKSILVIEPFAEQREKLVASFGVAAQAQADARLATTGLVIWAVKPQLFARAAAPCATHVGGALQLSVMAGIRASAITKATGAQRIVRAMPNTPALIGRGVAGLFARPEVSAAERAWVEQILQPTGALVWVEREEQLDAVTAVSGSGPAYVFYLLEAMMQAATEMGLSPEQGRALALGTFDGATALAAQSLLSPNALRAQVTSKGGTTHAAITSLDGDAVMAALVKALHAAKRRAAELGDEFG